MKDTKNIIKKLGKTLNGYKDLEHLTFDQYSKLLSEKPESQLRSIFLLVSDFINFHLGEGVDEYPNDPESIHYLKYNTAALLEDGMDHPFFADRIFANRLVSIAKSIERGTQQNRVYSFEGPKGCGKSTFLNNFLASFERYANGPEGIQYEIVWNINRDRIDGVSSSPLIFDSGCSSNKEGASAKGSASGKRYLSIPCPNHDPPFLIIPKKYRMDFFDAIIEDGEFKDRLFNSKRNEWVFKDRACGICDSLYHALLEKLKSPEEVFSMIFARKYEFSRARGQGISVFSSTDAIPRDDILSNLSLQKELNDLFGDSVPYLFSRYAKTNRGIYAIQDVKDSNRHRFLNLHNIVSEGLHKVGDLEEPVTTFFISVTNPEDLEDIKKDPSREAFIDRIDTHLVSYVLEYPVEVKIYKEMFGEKVEKRFLPRVLDNFAKVIIATRLESKLPALKQWIPSPTKYLNYADDDLLLLKMEVYRGEIPSWLSDEDRRNFNAKKRRNIIDEAKTEGRKGITGRQSTKLFRNLLALYESEKGNSPALITMKDIEKYFSSPEVSSKVEIPANFLSSLKKAYDNAVLQDIKESLYYFNEDKISKDVVNYLHMLTCFGRTTTDHETFCANTGETLIVNSGALETIESKILSSPSLSQRIDFRKEMLDRYVETLNQDVITLGKKITETDIYQELFDKYVFNIKANVLEPFETNDNFRNAIKAFGTNEFKKYDGSLKEDVKHLMSNLKKNHGYTVEGAKSICLYVLDDVIPSKKVTYGYRS